MTLAVGIDLGTTNSCVAVVREGKARVVQDSDGVALHPSVVSFHPDGRVLVGTAAAKRRVIDPQSTFYSVKRLIGRDFTDPEVQQVASRYPYEIAEGPKGIPLARARGNEYTLPEISSMVLAHLKELAVEAIGEEAGGVVITVPANFNDVQRSSTRVAGKIAGLDVQRILNEPTAAALAYGYGQGLNERVAVYDFGGGTFDITILDLRENVFEVLATAGDMFLGGDDFDARVVDQMVASFLQLHHVDIRENTIALQRLRGVAEQIKCQLSSRDQVSARVRELEYGPGGKPLDMNFSISRDGFEQRIADLVDRSFGVCDEAFRLAQMSPSQLDNVILVGGTTRIPMVRQRVSEFFGRVPRADINPDEVVAIGAAIQAFALAGPQFDAAPTSVSAEPAGAFDGGGGTQPGLGSPRSASAVARPQTQPGVGRPPGQSAAAAAFGVEMPDDLPAPRGAASSQPPQASPPPPPQRQAPPPQPQAQRQPPPPPQASQPSAPAVRSASPSQSAAAAAFGDEMPDDLPAPAGQGSQESYVEPERPASTSAAAAAFGDDMSDDLPAPRGMGGTGGDLPARSQGGGNLPARSQGGGNLPAPRQGLGNQSNLPTTQRGSQQGMLPTPSTGSGQPAQRPSEPSAAAAAFGDDMPDDLPAPRGLGSHLPTADQMDDGSTIERAQPDQGWGGAGLSSEESVLASFQEDVKAPASIGRPPPGMFDDRASSAPPPQADPFDGHVQNEPGIEDQSDFGAGFSFDEFDAGAPLELDQSIPEAADEGGEWDVLSVPGAPIPKVTPAPSDYVESTVDVVQQQQEPASAMAGVQAPGVAPLPSQMLQEMGVNHILIDVTPRTLSVQTVQGYCDPIIERNSPIPIEQSRVFTTSRDDQTVVVIRICQGESRRAEENTVLGEVQMSEIRPAPRGDVRIAVAFEIDTDGVVAVSARDVDTGQQAVTQVSLFGGMSDDEVRDLVRRYGQ